MTKTSIVVLSDVHVGSKYAVMSPTAKIGQPLPTDDDDVEGGVYHSTKAQRALYDAWKESVAAWKKPDILIINGELIDGPNPKQPSEVWTTTLYDQMTAAKQLVDMYEAKKIYMTRGSDYHVTVGDQQFEEYLGAMLKAERIGGKYAPTELNFEVQGKFFNAAHHIGTSTATWYRTTPIAKEMVAMLLAASHRYNSDVMIRSHIHFHVVVAFSRQIGVTTPCWKLQDWYIMKKSIGASTPDIGAMRFTVEDGEVDWQVKTFKFPELRPPLIKVVGEK